jgi:hypothetical protein
MAAAMTRLVGSTRSPWLFRTSSLPDRVEQVLSIGGERDVEQLQQSQIPAKIPRTPALGRGWRRV